MIAFMRPFPNIDVDDLRELAARMWDALTTLNCSAAATDRYDRYLATGAVMLWNGASETAVGDHFADVEINCLGLDKRRRHQRARTKNSQGRFASTSTSTQAAD